MKKEAATPAETKWRHRLYEIIFEAETVELSRSVKKISTQMCPECHTQDHDADAIFCKYCASRL